MNSQSASSEKCDFFFETQSQVPTVLDFGGKSLIAPALSNPMFPVPGFVTQVTDL